MTRPVCALTGASGYVGSVLRPALESAGWKVVDLSRRAIADPASRDQMSWSLGAANTPIQAQLQERGVSALVHAAWDLSLSNPREMERVNVQGSLALFEQARLANLRRTVFISSISAFAGARSLYGRHKLAVEHAALASGGLVIRPGMVYGEPAGAIFAALKRQAGRSSIIPIIGDGSYPQFLVHHDDLASAVVHALAAAPPPQVPVTVAHRHPWPLRILLEELARAQANAPHLLSLPWPLFYAALRAAEGLHLRTGFRSDSVLSLVYQNPQPEMNAALLGVEPRLFSPGS
ncbi:MAG TPA: NAD(P)-dependent oxidoreductase [Acidobacteriaceae bacterium]|nr:NAD(P)-dependent oxidoreductase [Acidobacteriaceae bacterium]